VRARDNPFRTERVLRVRFRLPSGTWDDLLARFEALGRRAAIVGPQGSGKTTLLEDLAPRLRARGYSIRELRLDT
jgi:polynucleotide 5'-kinase involved in rRNA processing